jgi:hypothetical protein
LLVVVGVVVSVAYSSSPFRRITRDTQLICYQAGRRLQEHRISTVVSIGSGPFPETGVGWEAGYKSAFFGGQRMLAAAENIPSPSRLADLIEDLEKARPDAIMIWGRPKDAVYDTAVRTLVEHYPSSQMTTLVDPQVGEAGSLLFVSR